MLKTTKIKVIGLALVGVVALSGAVYATTSLAVGGASASPATAQATQTTTDSQLRATILDMLQDRMGLTGPEAEQFADQMIARMQSAGPSFDLEAMVDRCTQLTNANTGGWGMMGGSGPGDYSGWGMMDDDDWGMMDGSGPANGAPAPSSTTPSNPVGQNGDWGMMNGVTTPDAGASDPSGATPSSPSPRDSGSGFTPGAMGGGMTGGGMMGAPGLR